MSNIDLKAQLEKQMLGYLHNELIKDANEPTLYRLSYGQYEVSSYKGELLIEFDTHKPGYGIYYGFMITKNGLDANEAAKINKIFVPIRQYLEFVLKKFVYLTDGIYNSRVYWAFWLRCNDFDIDSAKKHMEIIQDYFNQLVIVKYPIVKI